MMMMRIINLNLVFVLVIVFVEQRFIRFFLLPELPDINIPTWPMLWLRPVQSNCSVNPVKLSVYDL
jgi:hypothetical protein